MAPRKIDETYTEFDTIPQGLGSHFTPSRLLGRFFAKFFASKAQKQVTQELERDNPNFHNIRDSGDTIVDPEPIRPSWSVNRNNYPILPQKEVSRKERNKEFEVMDAYPEIGTAFDIYADDCTQKDAHNNRWKIESNDKLAVEEVERAFKKIKLHKFYWDIIRNTVKYGDCFVELVVDLDNPKSGIHRVKILNPNFILRVENEYGYLTDFLQEIPDVGDSSYGAYTREDKEKYIVLDKNQIVHFRLHSSDPTYYPYGKSIAAAARNVYRSLKMMEDAMVIYRLSRAPERRVFYVDVGNLPATKANQFIERLKEKFKKEKFYDRNTGTIDSRYNVASMDEDFFVPVKGNKMGTKIETLPAAENLGEVDDVKYFRDKLLATLKIPKDYVVEKDKSPERKANLSQLDVKFARTILRVQNSIEVGLESIAKRHLQLKQFPQETIDELQICLPEPSDMFIKRKLDVEEQKSRAIQAVKGLGLFPVKKIYKDFYDLTDQEIEEIKREIQKEMDDPVFGLMHQALAPEEEDPMVDGGFVGEEEPQQEVVTEEEPEENIPPTQNVEHVLSVLKKNLLLEGKTKEFGVISRMIERKRQEKAQLLEEGKDI